MDGLDGEGREVIAAELPAALAGLAVMALAGSRHPERSARGAARPPAARSSPVAVLGRALRRACRRPPDEAADRWAGLHLLVILPLAVVAPPLAGGWFASACLLGLARRRRAERRLQVELVEELPEIVDLLSLAVSAGLTVPLAVAAVAGQGGGRIATELGRAVRAASHGSGLADSLEEIPVRLGEAVRPLVRLLSSSLRDGAELGSGLERLCAEVRGDRRRAAEERARRLPVRLLFPLVTCVLPAFALLTVVPLLAGILSGLLR